MNGPEHYREAEESLTAALGASGDSNTERYHLAAAQVHATLAQAAAFAMAQPVAGMADEQGLDQGDFDDWYAAVNGLPPETRKPIEEYPGELAHLRVLLASLAKAADGNDAMNELLIDHFSDSRIVDPQLDAAADAEFAADTEGQR